MLSVLNAYCHGYVAYPIVAACAEKNLFDLFEEKTPQTNQYLVKQLKANPGYFNIALHALESLGWIDKSRSGYLLNFDVLKPSADLDNNFADLVELYKLSPSELLFTEHGQSLAITHIQNLLNGWPMCSPALARFADGALLLPLLMAIKSATDPDCDVFIVNDISEVLKKAVNRLFVHKNWAVNQEQSVALTAMGKELLNRVNVMAIAASYRPMLASMNDLLFGDAASVFGQDENGNEKHVDRSMNVLASGFQHGRYFQEAESQVVKIFDQLPIENQPNYIADMGCGDGTFLKQIYKAIINRSARGKVLEKHPVTLLGVDYNQAALKETKENLHGYPLITLFGDINDPQRLADDLIKEGVEDPGEVLHVRSFLDHNFSYTEPDADLFHPMDALFPSEGVYVDANGKAVNMPQVLAALRQHLRKWSQVISPKGMLLLESHCLPVEGTRQYFDTTESFYFDTLHAFSHQYLISAEAFMIAAANVGLFARVQPKRYPKTLPFCRITLSHYKKRDYLIRFAENKDLKVLYQLEGLCWAKPLRTTQKHIRERLKSYPQGQFVLELDGRVVGVIYSQRIENEAELEGRTAKDILSIHVPNGSIVQLITLNVHPEFQELGLGDQLLEFMLQRCSVMNGVRSVLGVTLCKDYDATSMSLESYIHQLNDRGNVLDPILRFHQSHGASIEKVIPGFRPKDVKNQGSGILIKYDIRNRARDGHLNKTVLPGVKPDSEELNQRQQLESFVESMIKTCLGKSREEGFELDRPLMEMGLDSADLLELNEQIRYTYQLELEPAFFFQHNTPEKVIAYLQEKQLVNAEGQLTSELELDDVNTRISINAGQDRPVEPIQAEPIQAEPIQAEPIQAEPIREDDIAIIGVACRLPGGINSADEFWSFLQQGKNAIGELPSNRFEWPDEINIDTTHAGINRGGFIDGIADFDANFFRITPTEAQCMDPQQRLLLQLTWHCLEDAGCVPSSLQGSDTGVFLGASGSDYSHLLASGNVQVDAHFGTGGSMAILPNRLSYFFDWNGPSLVVDTACSSSLVAVHQAVRALRQKECQQAMVGGINLICQPANSVAYYKAGMLSIDSQCKTFDQSANGYVRGEGAVMLMLKPLSKAIVDSDQIHAVIKGSACNHGGLSGGLTVPSPQKQAELLCSAWSDAGISPDSLSYIEAHGTGTPLGDPIEVQGIKQAISEGLIEHSYQPNSCGLGSLKSNIGHLEAAAGIAGLLKAALCLKNQSLVPTTNFEKINPKVQLQDSPLYIVQTSQDWQTPDNQRRCAGVSSFGFGGANGHVVLEEYRAPAIEFPADSRANSNQVSDLLPIILSAKTEERLQAYADTLLVFLQSNNIDSVSAVMATLQRREPMQYRVAFVVKTLSELKAQLQSFAQQPEKPSQRCYQGNVKGGKTRVQQYIKGGAKYTLWLTALADRNSLQIADLWASGMAVDWYALYGYDVDPQSRPTLLNLPGYPFKQNYYWLGGSQAVQKNQQPQAHDQPRAEKLNIVTMQPDWQLRETALVGSESAPSNVPQILYLALLGGDSSTEVDGYLKDSLPGVWLDLPYGSSNSKVEELIDQFSHAMALIKQSLQTNNITHCICLSDDEHGFSEMLYSALLSLNKEIGLPVEWYNLDASLSGQMTFVKESLPQLIFQSGSLNEFNRLRVQDDKLICEGRHWQYQSVSSPSLTSTIKHQGVYWIVGGHGGIGQTLATFLAEKYQAIVIVSGRSKRAKQKTIGDYDPQTYHRLGVVYYQQADCTSIAQMTSLRNKIDETFGRLNGVIHAAGLIKDKSLFSKTSEDIQAVMRPKMRGVEILDQVTKKTPLDFFVSFSSLTALFGNAGQFDYAAANQFLSAYTQERQRQVQLGERVGLSSVIHWPYWQSGGMQLADDEVESLSQVIGSQAISDEQGLTAFEQTLQAQQQVVSVINGEIPCNTALHAPAKERAVASASRPRLVTQQELTEMLASLVGLSVNDIDGEEHFSDLGMDSILLTNFAQKLNKKYDLTLRPLDLHNYPSLSTLSSFIGHDIAQKAVGQQDATQQTRNQKGVSLTDKVESFDTGGVADAKDDDVAIIGVNLRIPGAESLQEFWRLLEQGDCAAGAYPEARWQRLPEEFTVGKRREDYIGNFLDEIMYFDHKLFKTSPREAMLMDPQQRLLLHSVWQAIENAGYSKDEFSRKTASLFLAINSNDYAEISQYDDRVDEFTGGGSSRYIAANRLSHFFNLRGLSETIDTACSSFFVGLDRACDALRKGVSEQAIVAGVQANLLPKGFDILTQQGLLSGQGKTLSFGANADGFIRSEGVGSVILKPMKQAIADNDHVFAVLKSVGVWHAGKAIGLTAPSTAANQQAMQQALKSAQVTGDQLSYIEAHGTAMNLGDVAEVDAFNNVFAENAQQSRQTPCYLSATKPAIGHLEAASGVAVLVKAILAMQKGQLPRMSGLTPLHDEIRIGCLQVNQHAQALPRINEEPYYVGLNSYGLGGVSAFVLLQSAPYNKSLEQSQDSSTEQLFVLSALTEKALSSYLDKIEEFLSDSLSNKQLVDFDAFIHTYQNRREAMPKRIAIVTNGAADLLKKIDAFKTDQQTAGVFHCSNLNIQTEIDSSDIETYLSKKDWSSVGGLWVNGHAVDWQDAEQLRYPFPEYPIAKEREFWISRKHGMPDTEEEYLMLVV